MEAIKRATGCTVTARQLEKKKLYDITEYGAIAGGNPVDNTNAINMAIMEAAADGGGTVVIPMGEYKTYTIRLQSNVNIFFEKGAIIRAARCDIEKGYQTQVGEGGNYDEPEVNLYVGLQDHGHSFFANSLVYGADLENIMIYGEGLFDGSFTDEMGYTGYTLLGGDPFENEYRNKPGHTGFWFGNKGISLVRCNNVVLKDFSIVDAGHFAIIAEGVTNMLIDSILVDTIRDALDVDCCQDVTVLNSKFNSLTDDALVLKASYGAGLFMPLRNVFIDNCEVTGFDAGSVYAGKYTRDKLIATDRCGPTARVKLGTESTCGYELVTIQNVRFKRSRGFALEAVDASPLKDIIFTDCEMENISSSPIFIRIGDRGRFPVTGNSSKELTLAKNNVRLDNTGWVLPNKEGYETYPALRYAPSYNYTKKVTADGHSYFNIVDDKNPVKLNPANFYEQDGHYYEYVYNMATKQYEPDLSKEIPEDRLCLYANAMGCKDFATVENIEISNITVKDADPRYPMIIMGLEDSHVKNVTIENISVEYRGGMTMEHAIEQRQLNTNWEYSQFGSKPAVQSIPWLVNTFFLKNEGLLPRMEWSEAKNSFIPSPYNVPELPGVYPEPSNWGILPAYGLYARHVDGLRLSNVELSYIVEDERPAMVFDDVNASLVKNINAMVSEKASKYVLVNQKYKRPTNLEYVPNQEYHSTGNSVELMEEEVCKAIEVIVNAPAPGTPADKLYANPTSACVENGFSFETDTDEYDLPRTVYRPYFVSIGDIETEVGRVVCFDVIVRNPATDGTTGEAEGKSYNEGIVFNNYTVECQSGTIWIQAENLPEGADFDELAGSFIWTPEEEGEYDITFTANDGVIPISMTVHVSVSEGE